MKKFVCVLLMIMAVAAFAGCGKKDEDVSGGEGSESGAGQETAVEGKHHVEITVRTMVRFPWNWTGTRRL